MVSSRATKQTGISNQNTVLYQVRLFAKSEPKSKFLRVA